MENKFMQPGKFKVVEGSVLTPEHAGLRYVLNFVSQDGKFDNKTSTKIATRWVKVREDYKMWRSEFTKFKTGNINQTPVQSDIWINNVLVFNDKNELDTKALEKGLDAVLASVKYEKATVHVDSEDLERIPQLKDFLNSKFINNGIHVSVYKPKN